MVSAAQAQSAAGAAPLVAMSIAPLSAAAEVPSLTAADVVATFSFGLVAAKSQLACFRVIKAQAGQKKDTYELQPGALPKGKAHVFFANRNVLSLKEAELLVRLEYGYFPPNSAQADEFNVKHTTIDGEAFVLCSFPVEFQATCLAIAKSIGLTLCTHANKAIETDRAVVVVPNSENMIQFCIQGFAQTLPPKDKNTFTHAEFADFENRMALIRAGKV
jgi:hypothetical protein